MNELRKELERQFRAHGLLQPESSVDARQENTAEDRDEPVQAVEIAVIEAPKGYDAEFAEDFKNLSFEWQKFLRSREDEFDKKFGEYDAKIKQFAELEDIYHCCEPRLSRYGISCLQDWLKGLAWIDQAMEEDPAGTLKSLASSYGVDLGAPQVQEAPISGEAIARIRNLEHSYHKLASYLQDIQARRLVEIIEMFGNATDENGHVLHPFFDAVKQQVWNLLSTGAARDVSEAYEQALWCNPEVRNQLIQQRINAKAAEAQKAKTASFSPKGKAEAPKRELTLREELEKNFAAFRG